MEYLGEVISGGVLVLVAIIEARANIDRRECKAEKEKNDKRSAIRAKESMLSMQMLSATLDLSDATSLKVQQGKCNGEMDRARKKAEAAQEEYEKFMQEVTSRETTKY